MTKLLVFGNGLLGQSFATVEDSKILSRQQCDITDKDAILAAITSVAPDAVVNCAGIVPKNRVSPEYMFRVNSFAPHAIADVCYSRCKFVHISTNCVFNGQRASYSERDDTNAVDMYGVSKTLGEPENALVIRTSFIGLPDPKGRGLLAWAQSQKNLIGYDRVLWNGVTTKQIVKTIHDYVKQDITGIRHVHAYTYSKYDILVIANEVFGWGAGIIKESDITDIPHVECKTLMSLHKNGYIKTPIEEQLKELL